MSYLVFEHAIAIQNPIKRKFMTMGSGGEIVHVEFLLPSYQNLRASSWNGFGVGFKTEQIKLNECIVYDLGMYDKQIYDYFKQKEGQAYDLKGLVTNMILKLSPTNKDRFFCSEIVYEVLQNVVGLQLPALTPSQVSPHQLYQIISTKGLHQVYF